MFKILTALLLIATSFAQRKTWQELIASGEHEKLATTLLLNESFQIDYKSKFPDSEPEVYKSSNQIGNGVELNNYHYYNYFLTEIVPYEKAAGESILQKNQADTQSDKKYQEFRNFLIYSQEQPKLRDTITSALLSDSKTNKTLLLALLKDPNPELRSSFARAFWRELASENYDPKKTYEFIQLFMENTNKDDLIAAVKVFERDGFLSDSFNDCSLFFAAVSHILVGEKNADILYSGEVINEALKNLEEDKKNKNTADLTLEQIDANIQMCNAAKALFTLSSDNQKKLISDSVFQKDFWGRFDIDEEKKKWLQQAFKFMVNQTGAKGIAPSQQIGK